MLPIRRKANPILIPVQVKLMFKATWLSSENPGLGWSGGWETSWQSAVISRSLGCLSPKSYSHGHGSKAGFIPGYKHNSGLKMASLVAQLVKNLPAMQEIPV